MQITDFNWFVFFSADMFRLFAYRRCMSSLLTGDTDRTCHFSSTLLFLVINRTFVLRSIFDFLVVHRVDMTGKLSFGERQGEERKKGV